ncbi:MAG: lipocalin family protein [Candidatus Krumholzibacteriia bacterium]
MTTRWTGRRSATRTACGRRAAVVGGAVPVLAISLLAGAVGSPGPGAIAEASAEASAEPASEAVAAATGMAPPPAAAPSGRSAGWRQARPDHAWEFPRAHWRHPGFKTEWWYFTGHLAEMGDDAGALPRYGFQFTFFRVGLLSQPPRLASAWAATDLIMGHASVTDVATGEHVFSEVLYRAVPLLGGFGAPEDSLIAWSRGPAGTAAPWRLMWTGTGFRITAADARRGLWLDLVAEPLQPHVFQGPNGYSPKSAAAAAAAAAGSEAAAGSQGSEAAPGSGGADGAESAGGTGGAESVAASLYYSFPRLAATGTVAAGGPPRRVRGQCWMDREIFTSTLAPGQTGWDWLSLQLDDGRELMLYRLRDAGGAADYGLGTLVEADGTVRRLSLDEWSWTPLGTWRSPETGAVYPVRWRLQVPSAGLDLELAARVDAQENVSRRAGIFYWEGAVAAAAMRGSPGGEAATVGLGYVELTGYGPGSRPPL